MCSHLCDDLVSWVQEGLTGVLTGTLEDGEARPFLFIQPPGLSLYSVQEGLTGVLTGTLEDGKAGPFLFIQPPGLSLYSVQQDGLMSSMAHRYTGRSCLYL